MLDDTQKKKADQKFIRKMTREVKAEERARKEELLNKLKKKRRRRDTLTDLFVPASPVSPTIGAESQLSKRK